jgi:hypothetical protein
MSGGKRAAARALHLPATESVGERTIDGGEKRERERGSEGVFQNSTVFPPTPAQLALRSEEEAGGRLA